MIRRKIGGRGADRRRPGVEGLESRRLMAVTSVAFPIASQANAISAGLDNNLWFTEDQTIGAINPANGFVGQLPLASARGLKGIVFGKDGNIDVADTATGAIGVLDPRTGAFVEYPTPTANSSPSGMTMTPDGTIWFTESTADRIASFNPTTHAFAEFALGLVDGPPGAIAVGPDGGLWVGQTEGIAQFNPTTHSLVGIPDPDGVTAVTAGPDGQVWFGTSAGLGEINPATHVVSTFPSGLFGGPTGIATGPDGQVYFTGAPDITTQGIGVIDPSTHATAFSATPGTSFTDSFGAIIPTGATGLVAGPDGRLWFSDDQYIGAGTILPAGRGSIAGYVQTASPAGTTVFLDVQGTGILEPGDPTAVADSTGYYSFGGLAPGSYTVGVAYPGNLQLSPTVRQSVTVAAGTLVVAQPILFFSSSSILPLISDPTAFGTNNPDPETAEVNGLYGTILGRAPDPAGLTASVAYLKGGGSLQTLASILLHTTEYEGDVVAHDYLNILGRVAAPSEVAAWVSQIGQQNLTAEQVAGFLMTSAEFDADHVDDASFITTVYEDVLGRPAAVLEVSAWESVLHSGVSRSTMVSDMIHSSFAAQQAVEGFSTLFWGTTLDAADEAFDVAYLVGGGTLADVASAFASLPGFVDRAKASVG